MAPRPKIASRRKMASNREWDTGAKWYPNPKWHPKRLLGLSTILTWGPGAILTGCYFGLSPPLFISSLLSSSQHPPSPTLLLYLTTPSLTPHTPTFFPAHYHITVVETGPEMESRKSLCRRASWCLRNMLKTPDFGFDGSKRRSNSRKIF